LEPQTGIGREVQPREFTSSVVFRGPVAQVPVANFGVATRVIFCAETVLVAEPL